MKVEENAKSEKMGREDDLDHSLYLTASLALAAPTTASTVLGGGSANER